VQLPGGTVSYYLADHLGTSRVVTSATGVILDDSDFYPFGGEHAVVSSSGNNYKFTGKERDAETGLDEFGARYYSSALGRFASPDAFIYANIADPQSFNQYTYVYNNPLVYTDPSGHLATGQLGYASEGVGAPNFRMHPGGGLGACDEGGCTAGTLITSWELTVVNAQGVVEGTGIFFPSAAAAQAYIATQQQQQQPVSSLTVLGQRVTVTYASNLTADQRRGASNKLAEAAGLLNAHADELSEDQKNAIGQVRSISVVGPNELLGIDRNNVTLSTSYIGGSSAAWTASLFAHEGTHRVVSGMFTGSNAWRSEQEASRVQLRVGRVMGMSRSEILGLMMWSLDLNRAALQAHMEQGYRY